MAMSNTWTVQTRIIVVSVLLILIGLFVYAIRPLISPLIIAGLLAYILNPIAHSLSRRFKWSFKATATVVYFIFLLLLIAMPSTLIPLLLNEFRAIASEITQVQTEVEAYLADPVTIMGRIIFLDQIWVYILGAVGEAVTPAAEDAVQVIEATSSSLIGIVLVLVTSYYFLLDWNGLRDWLIGLFPEQEQEDFYRLLHEIDDIWWAYVRGTLALMFIMGVVFIIVSLVIGLPGAVALGLLTGFLSMIPELGPIMAGIIASLVALVEGSRVLPIANFWFALLVATIYLVVMQIKSLWLRPIVMGRFMHMNTGLVFVAIIGAIILQGVLGALIVLPILATVGIIGRYLRARLLNLPPWPEQSSPITSVTPSTPAPANQ